jgi:hypothetical protein
MAFLRRSNNTQVITGIFLLVMLAVFAGPNMLPRLSGMIPFADEGVPCDWLKTGEGRAQHQSLIGRAATNPLKVEVASSTLPNTPDGKLVITIMVVNQSIGTVGFVFNPQQVVVGDDRNSGLGLIFNPANALSTGAVRQDAANHPEGNIRMLGPRQRCVYKVEFPANQLDASLATGTATVTAYYRNNSNGQVFLAQNNDAPIVFIDQGLWIGFVESEPALIPLASQ